MMGVTGDFFGSNAIEYGYIEDDSHAWDNRLIVLIGATLKRFAIWATISLAPGAGLVIFYHYFQ